MKNANGRAIPVWRSLLYVPANVERFVGKAHERGADGRAYAFCKCGKRSVSVASGWSL